MNEMYKNIQIRNMMWLVKKINDYSKIPLKSKSFLLILRNLQNINEIKQSDVS